MGLTTPNLGESIRSTENGTLEDVDDQHSDGSESESPQLGWKAADKPISWPKGESVAKVHFLEDQIIVSGEENPILGESNGPAGPRDQGHAPKDRQEYLDIWKKKTVLSCGIFLMSTHCNSF
jgi:hypothetical protein